MGSWGAMNARDALSRLAISLAANSLRYLARVALPLQQSRYQNDLT